MNTAKGISGRKGETVFLNVYCIIHVIFNPGCRVWTQYHTLLASSLHYGYHMRLLLASFYRGFAAICSHSDGANILLNLQCIM